MTDERPAWHALLAPLPSDVMPTRGPVAPPEVLARPEGAAVAGWEQLVVHLSDPCRGLRTILVVLDADGVPVSASDGVFFRIDGEPAMVRHESIGGRFEADGTFSRHALDQRGAGSGRGRTGRPRIDTESAAS